jgi:hypothetical protein
MELVDRASEAIPKIQVNRFLKLIDAVVPGLPVSEYDRNIVALGEMEHSV